MRCCIFRVAAACVLLAPFASAQTAPRVRWSFSTGPTMVFQNERWVAPDFMLCGQCNPPTHPITGAEHGQYHFALGVSRELLGSALILRGEALYSRSVSSPNSYRSTRYSFLTSRSALRDEAYVVDVGFEWDALPSKSWSPYLLTMLGVEFNRLGWSRDPVSTRIDEQYDSFGAIASAGVGMRVRIGKRELFTEWRRQNASRSVYGSSLAPFSFGIRF
jgi:hypothetical protein